MIDKRATKVIGRTEGLLPALRSLSIPTQFRWSGVQRNLSVGQASRQPFLKVRKHVNVTAVAVPSYPPRPDTLPRPDREQAR